MISIYQTIILIYLRIQFTGELASEGESRMIGLVQKRSFWSDFHDFWTPSFRGNYALKICGELVFGK